MITLPMTNPAAPSHHNKGKRSLKIASPNNAVMMKLVDVLTMATRVVDEARVSAVVNRAHIRALKARFRRKKIYFQQMWSGQ